MKCPCGKWLKAIGVEGLLVLVGLAVIALMGLRTIANADIWMHLAAGRWISQHGIPRTDPFSFSQAGAKWTNTTWLYDRLLFSLWEKAGPSLVIVLHAGAVVLAFALLVPVARRWAGNVSTALTLLLSTWLLAPLFNVGPTLLILPIAAAFILVLATARRQWMAWAVLLPLQILWSNLHPIFFLGPVLCALFAAEALWQERRQSSARSPSTGRRGVMLLGLTAACAAVALINPYGLDAYRAAWRTSLHPGNQLMYEWSVLFSPLFSCRLTGWLISLAMVIGAAGLVTEQRNLPPALSLAAVISAFMMAHSSWMLPLFSLLAFPFLALSLDAIGEFFQGRSSASGSRSRLDRPARHSVVGWTVYLLLAVISAAAIISGRYYTCLGSAAQFGTGVNYKVFPDATARVISRPDFPQRAFNMAVDGGFLLWRHPERTVLIDTRLDFYPNASYREAWAFGLEREPPDLSLFQTYNPDAVILNTLVPQAGNVAAFLLEKGGWRLVFLDGLTAIFVSPVSANQSLLGSRDLLAYGFSLIEKAHADFQRDLDAGRRPALTPRLMGAARMLLVLRQYQQAEVVLKLLVRGAPKTSSVWADLGACQLRLNKPEEAVKALEQATRLSPRNATAWFNLGQGYERLGQTERAQDAMARAQRLGLRTPETPSP